MAYISQETKKELSVGIKAVLKKFGIKVLKNDESDSDFHFWFLLVIGMSMATVGFLFLFFFFIINIHTRNKF